MSTVVSKATELRESFARGFAHSTGIAREQRERLLVVRAGSRSCALPIDEISGVELAGRILGVSSSTPGLIGLLGWRGVVIPVFSLAELLGERQQREERLWVARIGDGAEAAIGFEESLGMIEALAEQLVPVDRDEAAPMRRMLETESGMVPVVSARSILEMIRQGASQ